jgi:hypothetical protein
MRPWTSLFPKMRAWTSVFPFGKVFPFTHARATNQCCCCCACTFVGTWYVRLAPGPNPTIVSYNASAVKVYNAKSSLVRFENKNIFFYLCTLKNAGVVN